MKIGPTFGAEVIAAGLGGLPFSWIPDGAISGRRALSKEQNAALDAVIAAHDPTKPLPRPKSPEERLLDALIAEGVEPAEKREAIALRLKS